MFCARCGKEIDNDSTFCPFCGQKVDALVENKKGFQPSVSGNIKTVKLVGGIAAGLVILFGVIFGISKLTGGSEVKETSNAAEESEKSQETFDITKQSEELQEMADAVEQSEEVVTDSVSSGEDNIYSITAGTLCYRELKDFFQLLLGCYVDCYLGNCDVKPVNLSSMLKHTGVVGAFDLDTGMRVISDYSDELFILDINDYGLLYDAVHNKGTVNYRCEVSPKESNIPDTFRYYEGTDAEICMLVEIRFYIDDEPIDFINKYAGVVLQNCAGNPSEWLLAAAVLVPESGYAQVEGRAIESLLVSEDVAEVEIEGPSWKQSYLDMIKKGDLDEIESYCLKDINDDDIPELYVDFGYSYDGSKLYYILKDGSVKNISASSYKRDKVYAGTMHQGAETDVIYQYDNNTGDYVLVFDGYYEDDYSSENLAKNHKVNGQSCSAEEYEEQLNDVWDFNDLKSWGDEMELVSDKPLLEALDEY